jgi:hypothetical protein
LYDRTSEPFDAAFTTEEEDDTTPEAEDCGGVDVATTPDDPFIVLPAAVVFFMREPRMNLLFLLLNVRFALSFLSSLSTHLSRLSGQDLVARRAGGSGSWIVLLGTAQVLLVWK